MFTINAMGTLLEENGLELERWQLTKGSRESSPARIFKGEARTMMSIEFPLHCAVSADL